jgi:hypothetical protein
MASLSETRLDVEGHRIINNKRWEEGHRIINNKRWEHQFLIAFLILKTIIIWSKSALNAA